MAGKLNVAGAARALDAATGRATVTARAGYLALLTSAPTNTVTLGTMVEYSATGYARQAITMGVPSGNPMTMANTNAITIGPLTGATGATAVTHWAYVSAATGTTGDVIAQGDLTSTRTPGAGDSIQIPVAAVTIAID